MLQTMWALSFLNSRGGIPPSTRVDIRNVSVFADNNGSGQATAAAIYNSSGSWSRTTNPTGTGSAAHNWRLSGSSSDYDIRFTHTAGDTPGGSALNTWLNLGTNRSVNLTAPIETAFSCALTAEVRDAVTLEILDSGTIALDATGGSGA